MQNYTESNVHTELADMCLLLYKAKKTIPTTYGNYSGFHTGVCKDMVKPAVIWTCWRCRRCEELLPCSKVRSGPRVLTSALMNTYACDVYECVEDFLPLQHSRTSPCLCQSTEHAQTGRHTHIDESVTHTYKHPAWQTKTHTDSVPSLQPLCLISWSSGSMCCYVWACWNLPCFFFFLICISTTLRARVQTSAVKLYTSACLWI